MIPEMITKLLPFLDLKSTLCLAQAHQETQNVLEGAAVFKKLLKRSSPLIELDQVEDLVAILKLMKDPKPNLPEVLDTICESNPPFPAGSPVQGVKMGCPHHLHSYTISLCGFKLLEKVEGAFGTTEQTVESITGGTYEFLPNNTIAALASRLTRQQQPLTSIRIGKIDISSEEQADVFKTLMQAIPPTTMHLRELLVLGPIGPEGWKFLAEALQTHPGLLSWFFTTKDACNGAKREEMRLFWEALKPIGCLSVGTHSWFVGGTDVWRYEGEAGWTRLWQILEKLAANGQMEADGGTGPDGMGLDGGMAAQMEAQAEMDPDGMGPGGRMGPQMEPEGGMGLDGMGLDE